MDEKLFLFCFVDIEYVLNELLTNDDAKKRCVLKNMKLKYD